MIRLNPRFPSPIVGVVIYTGDGVVRSLGMGELRSAFLSPGGCPEKGSFSLKYRQLGRGFKEYLYRPREEGRVCKEGI